MPCARGSSDLGAWALLSRDQLQSWRAARSGSDNGKWLLSTNTLGNAADPSGQLHVFASPCYAPLTMPPGDFGHAYHRSHSGPGALATSVYRPGELLAQAATLPTARPSAQAVARAHETLDVLRKAAFQESMESVAGIDECNADPGTCSTTDTSGTLSPRGAPSSGSSGADVSCPTSPRSTPGGLSPAVLTQGSRTHWLGSCKPCAFVHKGVCASGVNCRFCHLCPPGEKKKRKRERKAARRVALR
mmetsp:Transcript_73743/g.171011  ORF Transcript_73743/g.171011 Transcript_73743/m.171011 type:complete len:246 (-) Transcript_73743:432-1169(-)